MVYLNVIFWVRTVTKQYCILIILLSSKNSREQYNWSYDGIIIKKTSWLVYKLRNIVFTDTIRQIFLGILKNGILVFVETCFIVYNITYLQEYLFIHFGFIIIIYIIHYTVTQLQNGPREKTYCCKPQDNILKSQTSKEFN